MDRKYFSSRLPSALEENELSLAIARRRAAGLPLIDLTETNPTRVGLRYPEREILEALSAPEALRYQPDPLGLPLAREAVARYCAESRGARVDPARVLLTASTSEAYALLFKLLCDPGDAVLVPAPSYPLFPLLAALESVRLIEYPLRWDGEWHLDAAGLEAALDAEPRARAVLVVSPGNPTGAYLKREEHAKLTALCAARDLALIADEVFADYPSARSRGLLDPKLESTEPKSGNQSTEPESSIQSTRPDSRIQPTCAIESGALTFTLSGLSKVCALPQLKLGWCVVSGPEPLVSQSSARLELIADTFLSVGTPVQLAAPRLLELRHGLQAQLLARVEANEAALRAARGADAGWDLLAREGGWSAILRVPDRLGEEALCLELLGRGVLAQPGYFYELPRSHLVLSLLAPTGEFARGASLLAEALAG